MRNIKLAALASVIAFTSSVAWAQQSGSMQGMNMQDMHGMQMGNMMGMHNMPATVNAVDMKTGLVDVTAEGMALKVHFPPTALTNVKAGDSITLHLGFTKP